MSIVLDYRLIDSGDCEKEFDSFADAVAFMRGIGEEMFQHVDITDSKDYCIAGYSEIVQHFEEISDLYDGEPDCMHISTRDGIGGGIHCNKCSAWFCY